MRRIPVIWWVWVGTQFLKSWQESWWKIFYYNFVYKADVLMVRLLKKYGCEV